MVDDGARGMLHYVVWDQPRGAGDDLSNDVTRMQGGCGALVGGVGPDDLVLEVPADRFRCLCAVNSLKLEAEERRVEGPPS